MPKTEIYRPELFFGLVGAVGTDLKHIGELFFQELRKVSYSPNRIRLTDEMCRLPAYQSMTELRNSPEDKRIHEFMNAGDKIRRDCRREDAVALLGLNRIRQIRNENNSKDIEPLERYAYIFHSLKHPGEVMSLREIYGAAFFVISAYQPRDSRNDALIRQIAKSRNEYQGNKYENEARSLIERDEKEYGDDYGQSVRDVFPLADLFIDANNAQSSQTQISRFIRVLFGYPYTTPTIDEHGMFHARAAACRSSDLSRQVGCVITTSAGEIISSGCNEVPKAGGGAVWESGACSSSGDYRDFQIGYDSTARMKHEIVSEILERLSKNNWLNESYSGLSGSDLTNKAMSLGENPPLKGARVTNIIEYGRTVHAEMSALTEAARRGVPVKDTILYCTTFPCHMCARHIIASGIKRVVYIEPYPKSMAKDLYRKSIMVDHDLEADPDAVKFEPFVGIAPRKYMEFFDMPERKTRLGLALDWDPSCSSPRIRRTSTYIDVETGYLDALERSREKLGFTDTTGQPGESADDGGTGSV